MSKLLEIKDLYGGYQEGVNVLQGINMRVEQGEAVGIIGLNGSGKSTLGKAVMNMLPYRSGEILFDGQDVSACSTHELAQRGMALMHQGGVVFPNLSVWENLNLAFGNSQLSTPNTQLQDIIPLLQQPKKKLMRIMADCLSGGQRQELALAVALSRKPRLIILDEPSAGLSPKSVEEMYKMLYDVRAKLKISIILIEQNIAKAIEFCDTYTMLRNGVMDVFYVDKQLDKINNLIFNP